MRCDVVVGSKRGKGAYAGLGANVAVHDVGRVEDVGCVIADVI